MTIINHNWNNTLISQLKAEKKIYKHCMHPGYVNATELCKASNMHLRDYLDSLCIVEFLTMLAEEFEAVIMRTINNCVTLDLLDRCFYIALANNSRRARRIVMETTGYVYLIQNKEGDCKIGFSKNPLKRFSTIQSHNSKRLILLKSYIGTKKTEKKLHDFFSVFKIRGEWFSSDVIDLFEESLVLRIYYEEVKAIKTETRFPYLIIKVSEEEYWVHPEIAVDIASWSSENFKEWAERNFFAMPE